MEKKKHYIRPYITWAYLALVVYGSLYPLKNWRMPESESWFALFDVTAKYMPRSDYITNLLVYIPLGILLTISLRSRFSKRQLIPVVTGIVALLSLALEWLQIFLPRVPSLIDWSLNVVGGLLGSVIAFTTSKQSRIGILLRQWRYDWFLQGRFADLGLVILAIWALAMTSPMVPVTSLAQLDPKLVFNSSQLVWLDYLNVVVEVLAIGFLVSFVSVTLHRFWGVYVGFILFVFAANFFVADRAGDGLLWLSGFLGILAYRVMSTFEISRQATFVLVALSLSYAVSQLFNPTHYVSGGDLINWLPFDRQLGKVQRFGEILHVFFIFLSLSYCAITIRPRNEFHWGMLGGFFVVFAVLILEARSNVVDVTEIILALAAWTLPWIHPEIRKGPMVV